MAKLQQEDVAFLSLTNTNGYAGMGVREQLSVLKAVITSDVMEDIRSAINVLAKDRAEGLAAFDEQWHRVLRCFEYGQGVGLYDLLESVARELRRIPLRQPLSEARRVALHGEMYVRRDHFSSGDIVDRLASRDIVALRAHVFEYLYYSDYNVDKNLWENKVNPLGLGGRMQHKIKMGMERAYESTIKRILGRSGLYLPEILDVSSIVEYANEFMDSRFTGEALLTTGSFFKDILHGFHGAISVGPFACMQARVAEAIITPHANVPRKAELDRQMLGHVHVAAPEGVHALPFLAIEADGNPFPQVVDAKLDVFALQVERLHRTMKRS
jgi:predicted nucleotide-binding protein (sugar kinase/HSP70/actin superfamily)